MSGRIVQVYAVRRAETDELEALVRTITPKRAIDRVQQNMHYARPATQQDMYEGGMVAMVVKDDRPPFESAVDPRQTTFSGDPKFTITGEPHENGPGQVQ